MKNRLAILAPADRAWLTATFARNRARFGDLRMEAPADPPAAPPALAPEAPPRPAPLAPPPAPGRLGPNGFPLNTPWREMEKDQQVAYWVFQGNKHQEELGRAQAKLQEIEPKAAQFDALSEASKSELERERDAAKAEVDSLRKTAEETKRTFGVQLVESRLAASASAKGMTPDALKTLAGDMTRFLSDTGVNADAVDTFLAALPDRTAEAGPPAPRLGLGGGNRGGAPTASGADLYAQMHPKRATAST